MYKICKKKYHYTYRITNTVLNKHYYGVRSSNIEPKQDLGHKYFSSSSDEDFIKDQKEHHQNYKYKVLKIFDTREEAINLEIFLHEKFNVNKNEKFYNVAKQGNGVLPIMYGKNNHASRHIGIMDTNGVLLKEYKGDTKTLFVDFNISKRTLYRSINEKRIMKYEYIAFYLDEGEVNLKDLLKEVLDNEEIAKKKNNESNSRAQSGSKNGNARLIGFFKDGVLKYQCKGNRKEFAKEHSCTTDEIRKSLQTGKPMYSINYTKKELSGYIVKYL